MANIFSLYGSIFIDNEKANSSIDKTTQKGKESEKSFASSFGSIAKNAAKVGTAVVGATSAAVGGLYAYATNVASTADTIDKASQKVGMGAEEYQKWQYAAGLCGIESTKLDAIIKKQQTQFASAKEGNSSLAETYKQLGLDINSISSADDAFNGVIAALADMEDETQRNAIANDLFGKSYAELAPMLNSGSEAIAGMKQECADLGGVMSQDAVSAGASLNDMISRVKTSFGGVINSIGSSLFPIIEDLLKLIVDNMPVISNLITALAPVLTQMLSAILPPFIQFTQTIMPILVDLLMQILPFLSKIIESILPVIVQLIQVLLPPILQIVELILPLLISLIEPLLPLLEPILALLQPFIDLLMALIVPLVEILNVILPPLIQFITTIIQVLLPGLQITLTVVSGILSGVFGGALDYIKGQLSLVINTFQNIIDFIKNVFTGNWSAAWQNVRNIFSNIVSGLGNMFKSPINFIIDTVNGFIRGLNKIKIPDWVPGVGGKGFNISLIKKLRVGLDRVPYDEMPAILHKDEAVLDADEAKEWRNNKEKTPENNTVNNYNNTIIIEKMEVRDEEDINRIAEELLFLQKKEV